MCVHDTARNTNIARHSVCLTCVCACVCVSAAMVAHHNDINDVGDEDGEDSLLMVHALEKNETCNITNTSTNTRAIS